MRANGKRAGEWPDDEYARRRAKLSEAEANGLGWIPLAEIAGDNRRTKPAGEKADAAPATLKMDLGDE